MHVMVLGAGLSGVTTAWYLQQAGFQVSLVDRQPEAARETSFANGGQISISHPEPWANPGAPWQILRWLGRDDAPLKFRPTRDPAQWIWGARFLLECLPSRAHRNTRAVAALATWSGRQLRRCARGWGLEYDQLERGILHLFYSAAEFAQAPERVRGLRPSASRRVSATGTSAWRSSPRSPRRRRRWRVGSMPRGTSRATPFGSRRRSPRMSPCRVRRCTGNAKSSACAPRPSGDDIDGVEVRTPDGVIETLRADAYVVCLGSYGPRLLSALGERLPIYPVKGYSITAAVADPARAPSVSLTDESRRIVCSRLGSRLRIAGTAELNGFDTNVRPERIAGILAWAQSRFPGAIDIERAEHWAGLRPATPGNVPLIGRGRRANLWLNTGHGTLGWTLSCGSAAALAELMCGRRPPVDFPFLAA
jgi:Glycine/D-amino acid oxidases (deaminating)